MKKQKVNYARVFEMVGNLLIALGAIFLVLTFGPAFKQEVRYEVNQVVEPKDELLPPDHDFSIVIPKIRATAPIFANVDPYSKASYLPVLLKGVAHAKGTSFPDDPGNTYLFAHSTDAFYNVGRYNAIFYLLGKLQKNDEITVWFEDVEYKYSVDEVKVVPADATKYLSAKSSEKILTLQTCYPPGTTLKRLIVIAHQVDE